MFGTNIQCRDQRGDAPRAVTQYCWVRCGHHILSISIIHLTWIYRDIYPIIFRLLKTDMHESYIKFVPSSTYTVPTVQGKELSLELVGIGASEPRGHGNHTR